MPQASESFSPNGSSEATTEERGGRWEKRARGPVLGLHLAVAYGLIEAGVWTPWGCLNTAAIGLAGLWILYATLAGPFSPAQLGIAAPPAKGSGWILLGGIAMAATLPLLSAAWRHNSGPAYLLPFRQAMQYLIWALVQQFILQSFFYVRLESLLGGRWAVLAAAGLFAAVHIPSPVLTVGSFVGGWFFCEMFRLYRNIFPLGLAHALLGLAMAASFSDAVLHHMRVGVGYLRFHP
jgi:membrane protease YdiL (CAAX protease family)